MKKEVIYLSNEIDTVTNKRIIYYFDKAFTAQFKTSKQLKEYFSQHKRSPNMMVQLKNHIAYVYDLGDFDSAYISECLDDALSNLSEKQGQVDKTIKLHSSFSKTYRIDTDDIIRKKLYSFENKL